MNQRFGGGSTSRIVKSNKIISLETQFILLLCISMAFIWFNNFQIRNGDITANDAIVKMQLDGHDTLNSNSSHINVNGATMTTATTTTTATLEVHLTDKHVRPPYAYAWILGSIHEDREAYKGFLWDILISANILRKLGSNADFWVYTRLSPESKLQSLPVEDRRLLDGLGINVKELEKPEKESFAQLVYDKFQTIGMVEYKRVIFLDADMYPLTNLDYLFHLSDPDYKDVPTILKPNLILATWNEPCNTGLFMVEPSTEAFAKYKDTLQRQREVGKTLPYPHFDKLTGWGFEFGKKGVPHSHWESVNNHRGFGWTWHAAHSDQGLMYYFARFIQKEMSIVIGDRVQSWTSASASGDREYADIESETQGVLAEYEGNVTVYQFSCDKTEERATDEKDQFKCFPPYSSVAHFMGGSKPWQGRFNKKDINNTWSYKQKGAKSQWFKQLVELNEKFNMDLDISNWNSKYREKMQESPLGHKAKYSDHADIINIESKG